MAIKSSTFGGVKLSGKDAQRFIRHMNEDEVNPKAQEALQRGRKALALVRALSAATSKNSENMGDESH